MSRRLAIWILIIIVFVAIVATSASTAGGEATSIASPLSRDGVSYGGRVVQDGDSDVRVAMLPIYGTMIDGDSPAGGGSTGADDIVRLLDEIAANEDDWDGIILELDTPGGSVLAAEEIADAIERLQADTDIKMLAWMRGTAASAGYYVAAPTDAIVAAPSTFTGSIGVILEYYVFDELAKEIGVEAVTIKSGKLKDIGNPLRQETAQERELFQAIIDEAYDGFVQIVADGRGLDEERVREIADGRIYTGSQAKELDLVDTLGLRREAYDELAELVDEKGVEGEDLQVVRFARTFGFLETIAAGAAPTLDTLATAKAVGGMLRGEDAAAGKVAGAVRPHDGIASLEYRAQLG